MSRTSTAVALRPPGRGAVRVVLLIAVLAQLLACHAVVSASAVGPVAVVAVRDSAPGEGRSDHDPGNGCEPATAPLATVCRDSQAGPVRSPLPDATEFTLALLALLVAVAVNWVRRPDRLGRPVAGRRRVLALQIIRV